MYYEAEPLPPLGTCKALYPFDGEKHSKSIETNKIIIIFPKTARSEGSIPMAENEELQIIELDQGDGWTRVRRQPRGQIDGDEGFVPTSYIEVLDQFAWSYTAAVATVAGGGSGVLSPPPPPKRK